jgi:hypothetical protein
MPGEVNAIEIDGVLTAVGRIRWFLDIRGGGGAAAWGSSSWHLGRAGAALDADLDGAELRVGTDKHQRRRPSGELLRKKIEGKSSVRERENRQARHRRKKEERRRWSALSSRCNVVHGGGALAKTEN